MTQSKRSRPMVSCLCPVCGHTYLAERAAVARGESKHCSTACYHTVQARPLAERFWTKVNKTDTCWLWTGSRYTGKWPYGKLGAQTTAPGVRQSARMAHHVSWEIHYGPVPAGQWVLHTCDNPPCVRPDHLFLGTAQDNSTDMAKKGRHPGVLTYEQRKEVVERYMVGDISQQALASEYGINQGNISKLIRRYMKNNKK